MTRFESGAIPAFKSNPTPHGVELTIRTWPYGRIEEKMYPVRFAYECLKIWSADPDGYGWTEEELAEFKLALEMYEETL